MKFIPTNRYLLIERLDFEQEDITYVLLPSDYEKQEIYGCFQILESAEDCNADYEEGERIVVLNSMVETINIAGNEFLVLLENHVIGFVEE
tara:strand:- start:820 stop:1092 length:273 start_codon:yes stop_codon:yes gene_type:complete